MRCFILWKLINVTSVIIYIDFIIVKETVLVLFECSDPVSWFMLISKDLPLKKLVLFLIYFGCLSQPSSAD